MARFNSHLLALCKRDGRYAYEAYEFMYESLSHAQHLVDRAPPDAGSASDPAYHVSARELLFGVRDLAVSEFGLMAPLVFRMWGINGTGDFGEIIFNLIDANLMRKSEQDNRIDFEDVFDLDESLLSEFRIELDELEWLR